MQLSPVLTRREGISCEQRTWDDVTMQCTGQQGRQPSNHNINMALLHTNFKWNHVRLCMEHANNNYMNMEEWIFFCFFFLPQKRKKTFVVEQDHMRAAVKGSASPPSLTLAIVWLASPWRGLCSKSALSPRHVRLTPGRARGGRMWPWPCAELPRGVGTQWRSPSWLYTGASWERDRTYTLIKNAY